MVLEALRNPIIVFIFSLLLDIISHALMLNVIFVWIDVKVSYKKTIMCSIYGVILAILPMVITGFIISDPISLRIWIYRLFIYPNPISNIIYYFAIKKILNFSKTRSTVIMFNQLLINYIITTIYLLLNDMFCSLFDLQITKDGFYIFDHISNIIIIGIWLAVRYSLEAYLKKRRNYLIIPPSYADKNGKKDFLNKFKVICVIYIVCVFYRTYWFSNALNPLNLTSMFIYFLFIIAILFYIFNITLKLRIQLMDWEMKTTGTYISSLLNVNQEFRSLKHDFNNVLQGYGGYIDIKDYEGLEKYHKKLFYTTKEVGNFLNIIEVLRSRIAVYSLLELKSQKAKKSNVVFSINSVCDITNVVIDDFDLCRMMGIVVDNAIEEAELSKQKQVNISFERKDNNTIIFVISNSTKNDVDTKAIFRQGYTTKENHMGIGLSQVVHILNSYEHCSFRINYHDNQFTIFLILHAPSEK